MNKEQTAKILHKIITGRTALSDEEWMSILSDWGTKDKFDPILRHEEWGKKPLISTWGNHISHHAFSWIVDEHGKDVLLEKIDEDLEPSVAHNIFLSQVTTNNSKIINKILKTMSVGESEKMLDDLIENDAFKRSSCMGVKPMHWEGDLKYAALLISQNQYDGVFTFVSKKPDMIKSEFNGRTLSSMMCTTPEGWDRYLDLGGTIFDPVYINPQTNEKLEKPTPLWFWLIQSKNFHEGIKDTLNSLLTRVVEDRPPQDGELVISEDDWQTLLSNKEIIQKEISLIMFEKEIEEDWKAARKTNKLWRDWRSNEGATFIHWIASNQVADFSRSQYKIKLNYPLMKTRDDNGNDITSYIFVGLITTSSMGWKRQYKFSHETFPNAMKGLIANNIIDTDPKRGVISQLLSASGASYFQRLSRYSIHTTNLQEYCKSFPYKCLWNGLDDSLGNELFLSSNHMAKLGPVITNVFEHSYKKDEEKTKKLFEDMDTDIKFQLLVSMIAGNAGNFSFDVSPVYNSLVDSCIGQDSGIPLESIDAMLSFTNQHGSRYYGVTDTVKKIQSYLSSQSMKKNIELKQKEKAQDAIENNEEAPVVRKRKRMM